LATTLLLLHGEFGGRREEKDERTTGFLRVGYTITFYQVIPEGWHLVYIMPVCPFPHFSVVLS
jgi:hypothetical protein